jgi:hypothetical protein
VRAGLLIILPALALAAWIGTDLIQLLLGRSLSRSDAQTIVVTFLMLGGMIIGTMAIQVPSLAAVTLSWYGKVALLMLVTSAIHVGVTALAYTTGELTLLGLAASASVVAALLLFVGAVYAKWTAAPLVLIVRELGQLAVLCTLAFVPFRLVCARLGDGFWDVPLALAALCLFVALIRQWLPEHFELILRIAHQVLGTGNNRLRSRRYAR